MKGTTNVAWNATKVTKHIRCASKSQMPCVLWFTGFSGSGKSTIANAVERRLAELCHHTYLLDGDDVRHGLSHDLGFSDEDREENIRRVGEVVKLFVDAGLIVVTAFISPFEAGRRRVRDLLEQGEFVEVYMSTPLEICEQRDPKGLYVKARSGEIRNFTGIDSEYEPPETPEVTLDTSQMSVDECVSRVIAYLKDKQIVSV